MRDQERGAALLSVLLLVAVMAVLAVAALEKLKISTHLGANGAAMDQARFYLFAAESISMTRISDLMERDAAATTLAGGWNGRNVDLPLPGGRGMVRVRDGGNCFNLNSLARGEGDEPNISDPVAAGQFSALMEAIGIAPASARRIAAATADWIDSDQTPAASGAEDEYYGKLETPYLAANVPIQDTSELRSIAGVTPEIYERLRPWVCALPLSDLSPINVNTLSLEQAPLFAMLLPGKLDVVTARRMLAQRPPQGYGSLTRFWALPALEALNPGPLVTNQTTLKTRWFALDISVVLGSAELHEMALLDADRQPVRLVRRSWGYAE